MTVEQTSSNLPAREDDLETGLDEFGIEDAVVPRLSIVHKDGQFKDSLTGVTYDKIRVIILGLVKQRILWHNILDDGDLPMCKSPNHQTGYPNVDEDTRKEKRFPWDKSGFDPKDYPPDEEGVIALPCDGCQLKEWGSHPDGKRPYCSEQFTLPVLYDPYENESWVPAILTIQKTGIKPIRTYLTSFARSKTPPYTAVTEIGLDLQHRGTTDYSVPKFRRVGDTESEDWREYSTTFKTLRSFLQAPPTPREDDGVAEPSNNENTPPATKTADVQAETEAKAANAPTEPPAQASTDADDLPF